MAIFRGINVVSLHVPDLGAARDFYQHTLELGEPLHNLPDAGWVEFSTGGSGGNLAITTEGAAAPAGQGTTVVLEVDDCRAAHAALARKGVRCEPPIEFPGFVVHCTFHDPFGNRLQMCSPAPAEGQGA